MLQSLRGRGGTVGRWSSSSGDISFWSAGSSRRNRSVASSRRRPLCRGFNTGMAGIFSFLLVLAGVRAFYVISVIILLRLTNVPDEDLGVGIVHIAVGQLLATPDKLWVCGPCRSFAHRAQSLQISFLVPR
jgi:hypothetical protein